MFEHRPSDDTTQPTDETLSGVNADFPPAESFVDSATQRIFLPRGSAETRFAPRQYYYLASEIGVVPRWVVKAQSRVSPAH